MEQIPLKRWLTLYQTAQHHIREDTNIHRRARSYIRMEVRREFIMGSSPLVNLNLSGVYPLHELRLCHALCWKPYG
jgi:hypothetical protein